MRRYKIPIFESIAAWSFAVAILSYLTLFMVTAVPVQLPAHRNLWSLPPNQSEKESNPVNFALPTLHQRKRSLSIRSPPTSPREVPKSVPPSGDDDDSCTGKRDAYYPNLSSNCTSYFSCSAGYQATYLCEPGLKFNGIKCISGYECPQGKSGLNPCDSSPNGYYASAQDPTKYFYCYHKSKVIELKCSGGKVYDDSQKKCLMISEIGTGVAGRDWEVSECSGKGNGFYPDLSSGCSVYYYCIDKVKTQLECQGGLVFNGDICVPEGSFKCPRKSIRG